MLTLNNIIEEIRTFATSVHGQVNSFRWGSIAEVGETSPVYPLIHAELGEISSEFDEQTDAFFIEFAVLDKTNYENEFDSTNEALSDTKLIANDLIAYFKRNDFGVKIKIDLPVQMQSVIRAGTDSVSGWTFTLKMTLPQGIDYCAAPIPANNNYLLRQDGGYLLRQGGGLFIRN